MKDKLKAPFFREEGDSLFVDWDRIDVLIPDEYFVEPAIAADLGGTVDVLCFVDIRAYPKADGKPQNFGIRLPARVKINYSSVNAETTSDGDTVRVFTALKNEVFIEDLLIIQSADNVSALFKVLATARVKGVSYGDLCNLFVDGANLNGSKTGATRGVIEAIISEMVRWDKDINIPLRVAMNRGKATAEDFTVVKLKDLPRLNSVFAGVGFEDMQLSVQSAVRKTNTGEAQRKSVMEDLIHY